METIPLPPPPSIPIYLQDEETLNDECRDLLPTLPRERGWVGRHAYQYEGFWLPPIHLQGLPIKDLFKPRPSFPHLQPSRPCTKFRTPTRHPFEASRPLPSTRIFGSHAPIGLLPRSVNDTSCKIVYLTRDPKDVFVSLWHFSTKLRPEARGPNKLKDMFDKFCDGVSPYGPFWDHVKGFWDKSLEDPRKVMFLRYEEVKEDPAGQLRRLAEFLGCPFSPKEEAKGTVDEIVRLCSFDSLKNMEVNKRVSSVTGMLNHAFFRQGEVGGWTGVLTLALAKRLDSITEEKMRASGFTF